MIFARLRANLPGAATVVLRRVADSHDHNCSPELRGAARAVLGLGECDPKQDCPFRGGCGTCGRPA